MARIALLIGISEYQPGLAPLPNAVRDVEAMQRVLVNPQMGAFTPENVKVLKNPQRQEMAYAIEDLYTNCQKGDLVLFYFSGHGITVDNGDFYFSTRNTEKNQGKLRTASAVAARDVHAWMNNSKSKHLVVILDCCFSGAFGKGLSPKDSGTIDLEHKLGGEGRAILTASTSTQYAFESDGLDLSIYTHYLVEGIEKGAADIDGDGLISVDELHGFAKSKVQEASPAMTPEFYPHKQGYRIVLAKSPKDDPQLKYRKEVEKRAKLNQGKLSVFALELLESKRIEWGLSDTDANTILEEVLQPYREYQRKLTRYEQALIRAVKEEEYPFNEGVQQDLQDYQQELGLRDEDIKVIQERVLAPKEAEYQRQRQETQRLQEEQKRTEYEAKLYRYEQELSKAVQVGYPLDEFVRNGLKKFQQHLGLRNEDIASIEQRVIAPREAEYQRQQQEAERLRQAQEAERLRQRQETQRLQEEQKRTEYEAKLYRYEQELSKAVQVGYPLDEFVRNGLKKFQQHLGLRNEDIASIEQRVIAPREAEYQRQQQEAERLRQAQEAERLRQRQETQRLRQAQEAERLRQAQQTKTAGEQQQPVSPPGIQTQPFDFETATVKVTSKSKGFLGLGKGYDVDIQRRRGRAEYLTEDLGNGVVLEMVSIPDGKFLMGAPENEEGRSSDEGPQHTVTVPPFFMGKFPVTQAQWQVVAGFDKVNIDLKLDPSHFKGANRPVECVSWDDAVEFCARLSQKTGKIYRLPSEAEWEYACRGGTTTPFYFGETITTELVNYRGTDWEYQGTTYPGNYGQGPKGKYREQTTDVGKFPANPFGLFDMHGNIWEWCQDEWHDSYNNAPTDGSAWLGDNDNQERLLRGGSWVSLPWHCRAAIRGCLARDGRSRLVGFRVVCVRRRA
jgi:formylglycine-generating enzyme required for sulfatase activity/uncharacterized caspase-like protein